MILKFILWYLKRTGVAVEQHGKYGWKIGIVFNSTGNYRLYKNSYEEHMRRVKNNIN